MCWGEKCVERHTGATLGENILECHSISTTSRSFMTLYSCILLSYNINIILIVIQIIYSIFKDREGKCEEGMNGM